MTVAGVEGETKLSENRTDADQTGVADGLRDDHHARRLTGTAAAQTLTIAKAMTRHLNDPSILSAREDPLAPSSAGIPARGHRRSRPEPTQRYRQQVV